MQVLLVDDKKAVLSQVSSFLEEMGLSVETAENGLDGYEKALNGNYDLYIVDHLMPLMNGPTLVKNLKQKEATKDIPIVFMSTQALNMVTCLPESEKFDHILSKPIVYSDLQVAVSELINLSKLSEVL